VKEIRKEVEGTMINFDHGVADFKHKWGEPSAPDFS